VTRAWWRSGTGATPVTLSTEPAAGRATRLARPVRHAALATGLVLVVCAVIGVVSVTSYRAATDTLRVLTARATGTVTGTASNGGTAVVEWTAPGGRPRRLVVPVTGEVPKAGTGTQIAYDPTDPATAIIPGATVLTDADRARDGVLFATLVATLVLLVDGWLLASRWWVSRRRPVREITVRRISLRRGLMARTWLETDDSRWIPVYYEPAVLTLPAPATVHTHGDPTRRRLVAIDIPGTSVTLYPSGPVRRTEPPGRRTDSPTRPDAHTASRAEAAAHWRHQARVDAALLVPAPLLGVLWTYLDDGGTTGWLGATAVAAATALWWAAIRGTDPT